MIIRTIIQILRRLKREKLSSFINIIGLSVALVFILIISIFTQQETSVDDFHVNKNKIYRVIHNNNCAFSPPFGQFLKDNIDQVSSFCRTFYLAAVLKTDHNMVRSENILFTDSTFFSMFSFPLVNGDKNLILKDKRSIVLSEDYTQKLFGSENPLGKVVRFNNREDFVVSGVFRDFEKNTHFPRADVVIPFHGIDVMFGEYYLNQYKNKFFLAGLYVMTKTGSMDLTESAQKIYDSVKEWYWLFQESNSTSLDFQTLSDTYFNAVDYDYPLGARVGNINLIQILKFILVGLVLIVLVNFINMYISQTSARQKEFIIKRISGASSYRIFNQTVVEYSIILLLSGIVALILLIPGLNLFNSITDHHFRYTDILIKYLPFFILISLIIYLLSAFISTTLQSINIKNNIIAKIAGKIGYSAFQKSLVVFQFTVAIALIIVFSLIVKQNRFLKSFNVGFNTEETLFIHLNSEIKPHKIAFKNSIKQIAGINNASLCNGMPGVGIMSLRFDANNETQYISNMQIDDEYFDVMQIPVNQQKLTQNNCYITTLTQKKLNLEHSDKFIQFERFGYDNELEVLDVLPELHFQSLYNEPLPLLFTKVNTNEWVSYLIIRLNTKHFKQVLAEIEHVYKDYAPNFPFEYSFLSDALNRAYKQEEVHANIIMAFAILALFLSVLGMFALSISQTNERIKEIGIRKVNGARKINILFDLNIGFIQWVMLSFVAGCPIAWFLSHQWLKNFAYKTEISWWIFATALLITLIVAVLTVSWQSLRAATRNPVEALRYE